MILLCLSLQSANAQTVLLNKTQTERLAKMSQFWGHAHFFHPYLAYKNLPFDSAFAAAVPRVIEATDAASYAKALETLTNSLGDPATRIEFSNEETTTEGKFSNGERHPIAQFTADSTLSVTLNNYHDLQDWDAATAKCRSIAQMIPRAKAVLFDLRTNQPSGAYTWFLDNAFTSSGLRNLLSDQVLITPGSRSRVYDGFAPENGSTSGGYTSSFAIRDGERIIPRRGTRSMPIVFLVNGNSLLPSVALGLQAAGRGGIVAQGEISDATLAGYVSVDMGDGVKINLRTGELLAPDGTLGLVPNLSLPQNFSNAEGLQGALDYLKKANFQQNNGSNPAQMTAAPAMPVYPGKRYPDLGWRVLGAAKIWAVIHYFFAYKDLMTKDWNKALQEHLPSIILAPDSMAYNLAIAEMYARIEDGHGFINSPVLRDYFGQTAPPVVLRVIEKQAVITAFANDSIARVAGLEIGDIITHVDGEAVSVRLTRLGKYISAANASWRSATAADRLLRGKDRSTAEIKLKGKDGREKTARLPRDWALWKTNNQSPNERSGTPVFRILPGNIGYADLERLGQDQVDTMFDKFKNTKAIIFDMRGYPQGTAWNIAPRLSQKDGTPAAFFQRYSPQKPDVPSPDGDILSTFTKTSFYQPIPPAGEKWKYKGKTVMLIDERTMSQAEHSGLFYEAANGTEFIGSQTSGSNGDVTSFGIPGRIWLSFSGHDVRHADGRQLQKVGLVPKIEIRPTIAGIRAKKDEVLERAILYINSKK